MGSEADQNLNIKVTLTGDTAGAKQAETALHGVKKAAEEAGHGAGETAKQTKELGHEVKELTHLGHEAEAALEGLEQGGLSGIARAGTNAAKVLKTVGAALGGLSTGTVLVFLAAATAAVIGLKNAFGEEGEAAESAEKKTEKLNKALADIRSAQAEATAFQIKRIGFETEETIKRVQQLKDVLLHLNDNKLAVEQSKIKSSESLTPVQKERADFEAQSDARKAATDETLKAIQLEIDARKKEQQLRIQSLNEAVEEEKRVREEAQELRNARAAAQEEVKTTKSIALQALIPRIPVSTPGGGVDFPAPADPNAARNFDDAKIKLEEIEKTLQLLEGNGKENGGLIAAKAADVIEKSKAAAETDTKNLGEQGKIKRSGGELEKLETAAKVAKSDYETKQILANDEFVAKQKEETRKIETERAALEAEKKALADKNTKSLTLGGDPAAVARLQAITKRQGELDQDIAQRRGTIPQVQDNTKKRIKEFQTEQGELGKEIAKPIEGSEAPESAKPEGGSGGTIEKDGQIIRVSNEHTVEQLKKLGTDAAHGATETAKTASESAKAVAVATPKIQKAAAETASALAGYNGAILGTLEAQTKQIKSLTRQVEALKQQAQAQSDNS